MGEPTPKGPVTVAPGKVGEAFVRTDLPGEADEAELGDPPQATRTALRLRTAVKPRAMRQWPRILGRSPLVVTADVMTCPLVGRHGSHNDGVVYRVWLTLPQTG